MASNNTTGITDQQNRFIEWLVDPDPGKGTQNEWARLEGISSSTPVDWKRRNYFFRQALQTRMTELNMSPDRVQPVMDALWKEAKDGNVQAAKLYLDHVAQVSPPRQVVESKAVAEMTDGELEKALEDALAEIQSAPKAKVKNGRT